MFKNKLKLYLYKISYKKENLRSFYVQLIYSIFLKQKKIIFFCFNRIEQ